MSIGRVIKDITTVSNGHDFDIGRILLLIFGLSFVFFTGYDLIHNAHFDTLNFGIGGGAILGGGGAGIGMKAKTEPGA